LVTSVISVYTPQQKRAKSEFSISQSLLLQVESVKKRFWNDFELLHKHPKNLCDNLNPLAVDYLVMVIRSWFLFWVSADDANDSRRSSAESTILWLKFASRIVDNFDCNFPAEFRGELVQLLGEALETTLDKALETIVRMHKVLDHAYQKRRADPSFLVSLPREMREFVAAKCRASAASSSNNGNVCLTGKGRKAEGGEIESDIESDDGGNITIDSSHSLPNFFVEFIELLLPADAALPQTRAKIHKYIPLYRRPGGFVLNEEVEPRDSESEAPRECEPSENVSGSSDRTRRSGGFGDQGTRGVSGRFSLNRQDWDQGEKVCQVEKRQLKIRRKLSIEDSDKRGRAERDLECDRRKREFGNREFESNSSRELGFKQQPSERPREQFER
jgi:hypothetical protein